MSRAKAGFVEFKDESKNNLVIFIHGFQGNAFNTWNDFAELIKLLPEFNEWDMLSFNYPTSLKPGIPFWSNFPGLQVLSDLFKSFLGKLNKYEKITLVAHSMGGLIAQRVLLDIENNDPLKFKNVKHVILFGTPSNGLEKTLALRLWNHQVRDMYVKSEFILKLRRDWKAFFNNGLPFTFKTVAGLEDNFVPLKSSHGPFPEESRELAPGNHIDIVRPIPANRCSADILIENITTERALPPVTQTSGNSIAEYRMFCGIKNEYLPNWSERNDSEVVDLSLALEVLGHSDEAREILEKRMESTSDTDIKGVLAGRLKRSWLLFDNEPDAKRAYDLYSEAYQISRNSDDVDQALYNGINVAFMELVYKKNERTAVKIAREVLGYCNSKKEPDKWSLATEGEVFLITKDTQFAIDKYKQAIHDKYGANSREITSMYNQAIRILKERKDKETIESLDKIFQGNN